MVIIQLTQAIEVQIKEGYKEQTFTLPAGMELSTIDYRWLTDEYKEKWPNQEEFEKKFFIIYYRGAFRKIPKDQCHVPVCYRWGYNI